MANLRRLRPKDDHGFKQLNTAVLQIENEYYLIRPKRVQQSGERPVRALINRGVEYLECVQSI